MESFSFESGPKEASNRLRQSFAWARVRPLLGSNPGIDSFDEDHLMPLPPSSEMML